MHKYLVEFIGTFFLVFTIGNVVLNPDIGALAPLAIGSALMVMVYAGGHISGAHYNPAVTLAVFLRGECNAKDVVPYMLSQVAGASVAALAMQYLRGSAPAVMEPDIAQALLVEFLFTFGLCFVILNVATAAATQGNSYYGLAIGFTVLAGAYTVGDISGGVFNPAVAVGISILKISAWPNIWIYLVANFAGAVAATGVFKFVNEAGVEAPANTGE